MNHTDALLLTHFTHAAWKQGAVHRQGEDEVLSGLTVLDRNLWKRIEEMQ